MVTPSGKNLTHAEQARMEKPLTQTEYRVRDWLESIVEKNNLLHFTHVEVAKELNITRPQVTRAIKRLEELEIILVHAIYGRSKVYRLNPACCYSGTLNHMQKERNKVVPPEFKTTPRKVKASQK